MRTRYVLRPAKTSDTQSLSTLTPSELSGTVPAQFRAALSHRHLALEAETARLWIQEPGRGEIILHPGEVVALRPSRRRKTYGIAVHTAERDQVWFAPFYENVRRASFRQILAVDSFVCALDAACRAARAGVAAAKQPALATDTH